MGGSKRGFEAQGRSDLCLFFFILVEEA